jgi:anti-sigma B factor antagonist
VKPAGDERTPDGSERAAPHPGREQLMTMQTVDRDEGVVIAVDGEVDGLTAPRLRAAVSEMFEQLDGKPVIVDLTGVRFLGSAGLRALFEIAHESVHQRGRKPLRVVVDHTRPVVRPIEIVGLDNVLALYESVDDALAQ